MRLLLTGTLEAEARQWCAQQGLTNSETGAGGKGEWFIQALVTGEVGAPHPKAHGSISMQAVGFGREGEGKQTKTSRVGAGVGRFSAADSTVCCREDLAQPGLLCVILVLWLEVSKSMVVGVPKVRVYLLKLVPGVLLKTSLCR